jgi:hypothetical protein
MEGYKKTLHIKNKGARCEVLTSFDFISVQTSTCLSNQTNGKTARL